MNTLEQKSQYKHSRNFGVKVIEVPCDYHPTLEQEIDEFLIWVEANRDTGARVWESDIVPALKQKLFALIKDIDRQARIDQDKKYDSISQWLLGLNGDFPSPEKGKRFNWRSELRDRLSTLNNTKEQK